MTMLYMIVGIAGLATLPLWDAEWRLALALGWCVSLVAEALLARKRVQTLTAPGGTSLLLVITLGFLGRLALVVLGAVVGALGGLYPEGPFLGAFLAAMAVGELLSFAGLARAGKRARPAGAEPRPHDS